MKKSFKQYFENILTAFLLVFCFSLFLPSCETSTGSGQDDDKTEEKEKESEKKVTLSQIALVALPAKTAYNIADSEKFDSSGLVVHAIYSDGTRKVCNEYDLFLGTQKLADGFIFTESNTIIGSNEITVEYETFSAHFYITIYNKPAEPENKIQSITVTSLPQKTVYKNGDSINLEGLIVKTIREDGTEEEISGYTLSINGVSINETYTFYGNEVIKVSVSYSSSYGVFTTAFDLTVVDVVDISEFAYETTDDSVTITGFKKEEEPYVYVPVESKPSDFKYYRNSDNTIEITELKNSAVTELVIPKTIDGYTVTEIGQYTFTPPPHLHSLVIEAEITYLGVHFTDCQSLVSVQLPETLKRIGYETFKNCSALETINIPSGVTEIGRKAFYKCAALKTSPVLENLSLLGDSAFYGCSSLEEISLSDSLKVIGANTFNKCSSLKSCKLGKNIEEIRDSAFWRCCALSDIEMPSSLKWVDSNAFAYCTSLEKVVLEKNTQIIAGNAFSESGLKHLEILSSGVKLGGVENCPELEYLKIYNFVGSGPKNCPKLEKIVFYIFERDYINHFVDIPSLKYLVFVDKYEGQRGEGEVLTSLVPACPGCTNLESIMFSEEEEMTPGISFPDNSNFRFSNSWNSDMGEIGRFSGCEKLKSLTIGANSTIEFQRNSCADWTGLETLQIGANSKIQFNDKSFANCASLKNIDFGENSQISAVFFDYDEGIIFSNSPVEELDFSKYPSMPLSFTNCPNFKKIIVGSCKVSGVTLNKGASFKDCTSLCEVSINDDGAFLPTSLANTAFEEVALQGCSGVDQINSIGLFENCKKLKKISFINCGIPSYLFGENGRSEPVELDVSKAECLSAYSFYKCDFLTEITFNFAGAWVCDYAFAECKNLKTVDLGNCWTFEDNGGCHIGKNAFYNCESLETVINESVLTYIDNYVFYNCAKLKSIPELFEYGMSKFGNYSFAYCENLLPTFLNVYVKNGLLTTGAITRSFRYTSYISPKYTCTSLPTYDFDGIRMTSFVLKDGIAYIPSNFHIADTFVKELYVDCDIEHRSFADCTALETVHLGNSTFHVARDDSFEGCTALNKIIVPAEYYSQYISSPRWEKYRSLIVSE